MIYLLDANTFIEAKNRHYRMQNFPGFWQWLLAPKENNIVQSICNYPQKNKARKSGPGQGVFTGWIPIYYD